jgi:predicted phage terminase large subunit-like protein
LRWRMNLDQDKIALIKDRCENDLKFLCEHFLGYTLWDKVHDDVEKMLKKPSRRKAILLPRDHSKSTFVTIAWTIQNLLRNPNLRVMLANGVWDMARKFLMEIKGQMENSQLKYIYGDFVSARWNADDVIIKQRTRPYKEPSIFTTGVEAESVGMRADLIIADDLMGEKTYQTPEIREKVKRFRRSLVNLLEPEGRMVDIMTRWHLDDTFSEIQEKESEYYDVMVRAVVEDGKLIYPKKFSQRFDARLKTFVPVPEENCLDYVEYLKKTKPIDEFMSQFMNDPISSENQLFKKEFFRYWTKRPDGLFTAMAVDLAISQRTDADYTAIVVMGMDKDWNLYVLDYLRGKWIPSEIVNNIFDMQSKWKPLGVGMEVNGFQRTLKMAAEEEMRRRSQYFGIDEIRNGPDKSKENRIKSLEPFYRRQQVYHSEWMRGKEMETELLTFPKGKHDDIIDAMAMCLPLLSPGIGVPQEEVKPGTYEYVLREARRLQNRYDGFFNV